jgi:hypothetical protein
MVSNPVLYVSALMRVWAWLVLDASMSLLFDADLASTQYQYVTPLYGPG